MAARGQNDSITEQVSAPTEANDDESLSKGRHSGQGDAKGKYDKYTRGNRLNRHAPDR